jgi:hypothetical protein
MKAKEIFLEKFTRCELSRTQEGYVETCIYAIKKKYEVICTCREGVDQKVDALSVCPLPSLNYRKRNKKEVEPEFEFKYDYCMEKIL